MTFTSLLAVSHAFSPFENLRELQAERRDRSSLTVAAINLRCDNPMLITRACTGQGRGGGRNPPGDDPDGCGDNKALDELARRATLLPIPGSSEKVRLAFLNYFSLLASSFFIGFLVASLGCLEESAKKNTRKMNAALGIERAVNKRKKQ
jgi:hypothetical protein